MTWDLNRLRKIAGVVLTESHDDEDDDGLSASERELVSKADSDLKKKGIKIGNIDPDKDLHRLAKERSRQEKRSAKEDAADEPKATKTVITKTRGKVADPNSKTQQALSWIRTHGRDRKEFLLWAKDKLGWTTAHSSAFLYTPIARGAEMKTANEYYVLVHPEVSSFLLAENKMMGQYQWVDPSSNIDSLVFETENDAKKVAQYMIDWRNQVVNIQRIDIDPTE